MPTHGATATPAVVTSDLTMTFPRPTGLADGDYWFISCGVRASSTLTIPSGFEEVVQGTSGGTSASHVRAGVWRKPITSIGSEPASVDIVGSVNVFGVGFSWRAIDAGTGLDDITALLTADNDSNNTVSSPAVTPTKAGTLVWRLAYMNHPTAGFASGDFDPTDATPDPVNSPAMPSGTNRVSGGLAYEAGPGAGVSTGAEVWTVGGASWSAAVGITVAAAGLSVAVDAGDDQTVTPGELVVLDGTATLGADTLEWSLVSGSYPAAHLIPVGEGITHFIAPQGPATLVFRLTATSGALVGTEDITVNVVPVNTGLVVGLIGPTGQAAY